MEHSIFFSKSPLPWHATLISFQEFTELKDKLTSFHKRKWKNALILDWISQEKAKTLPFLEFYVGSKWKERRKALQNYEKELTSINDIVKVIDPNDQPRPVQIFIEGEWNFLWNF